MCVFVGRCVESWVVLVKEVGSRSVVYRVMCRRGIVRCAEGEGGGVVCEGV